MRIIALRRDAIPADSERSGGREFRREGFQNSLVRRDTLASPRKPLPHELLPPPSNCRPPGETLQFTSPGFPRRAAEPPHPPDFHPDAGGGGGGTTARATDSVRMAAHPLFIPPPSRKAPETSQQGRGSMGRSQTGGGGRVDRGDFTARAERNAARPPRHLSPAAVSVKPSRVQRPKPPPHPRG